MQAQYFILCYITSQKFQKKEKDKYSFFSFLTNIYGAPPALPSNVKRYKKKQSITRKYVQCRKGAFKTSFAWREAARRAWGVGGLLSFPNIPYKWPSQQLTHWLWRGDHPCSVSTEPAPASPAEHLPQWVLSEHVLNTPLNKGVWGAEVQANTKDLESSPSFQW